MNEKQYQSMYRHICLSDEQKNRIWKNMRNTAGGAAAERKARFTLRGAVCICAMLMASGMTVLAVNSSYVERIAKAMGAEPDGSVYGIRELGGTSYDVGERGSQDRSGFL